MGWRGRLKDRAVLVGTERFLRARGMVVADAAIGAARDGIEAGGGTAALVAAGGRVIGVLGISDTVRASSRQAVRALQALGVEVHLVSGDNARTAEAVARAVGIAPEHVRSGVRPEGKAEEVARLRRGGRVVAMVGDGVNDAPALAAADVGMAIGGGSDAAIESASITLVRGDVAGVVEAIALSRATVRVIRQNLVWAFGYNVLAIPIAAFGLLSSFGGPMLAAGAMALSSVSVVMNSLRLKRMALAPRSTATAGAAAGVPTTEAATRRA